MREYDFVPKPPPPAKPRLKKESYVPKRYTNAYKPDPSKNAPSPRENNTTMNLINLLEEIPNTINNIQKYIMYLINKKKKKHTRIFDSVIDDHKFEFFSNKEIKIYIKNNITQDFSFDRIISDEHIKHIANIDYSIFNINSSDMTIKAFYIYNYIKYGEEYLLATKYIVDKCIDNDMNFKFNLLINNTKPELLNENQTQTIINSNTKNFYIIKDYNDMANSYVKIMLDNKRIAQLDKLTLSIKLVNVKEQTFIADKLKKHIADTLIKIYKYNEYISNKEDYDYIENLIDVFETIPDKSMLEVTPKNNISATIPNIRITDI